jgi:hypothetical protein
LAAADIIELEARVRLSLAQDLGDALRIDEAIEVLQPILLDDDPWAARLLLLSFYVRYDHPAEARGLVERFHDLDDVTAWFYATALVAYRDGQTELATRRLTYAIEEDPAIAEAILGEGDYVDDNVRGDANYLRTMLIISPGATAWLRREFMRLMPPTEEEVEYRPWEDVNYKPEKYAVGHAQWMVDFVTEPHQKTGTLVVCQAEDFKPIDAAPGARRPTPAQWLKYLTGVVAERTEDHEWPATIFVRDAALQKKLTDKLKKCHVTCKLAGDWQEFDRLAHELSQALGRAQAQQPGIVSLARLKQLPVDDEGWFLAVRRLGQWVMDEGELKRAWAFTIVGEEGVLATQAFTKEMTAELLQSALAAAMEQPATGVPRRPDTIHSDRADVLEKLGPLLADLDISYETREAPDHLTEALSLLTSIDPGQGPTPVVAAPGATEELLAAFFAAVADFFRARPWNRVRGDRRILVTTPGLSTQERHAVVMGQAGEVFGLSLAEDRAAMQAMMEGDTQALSPQAQTAISLQYDEAPFIAVQDFDAITDHHWPVAAPEAYVFVMHLERGTMRGVLAWEIDLLIGVLRRILQLVEAPNDAVLRGTTPLGQELIVQWHDR